MTTNEIIEDFPELDENQIKACLAYAADREHKIQIASSLLFDQNISFRIISKIEANFPNSKQVRQLGIENYSILKYGSMPKKTNLLL
jgi:hypothetical protein